MKQLLIFILIFSISNNTFSQISDREKACIKAENMAKKDMYNDELKYYRFGLMAYDDKLPIENKILKEVYHIETIYVGCVVSDSILCYNKQAEKLIFRKYGKGFWDKLKTQVDSAYIRQRSQEDATISRPLQLTTYEPSYVSIM